MTATKHYIVQSRVRGQWGDVVKYEIRDNADRGLMALRKTVRDQPDRHKHVEGYRLISREYIETVLDPVAEVQSLNDLVRCALAQERAQLGRGLTVDETLSIARKHMGQEEMDRQYQMWLSRA